METQTEYMEGTNYGGANTAPSGNYDLTNVKQYIYNPNGLKKDIDVLQKFRDRKTGFSNLDENIMGLSPGLNIVLAKSSFGKTSFNIQMACNLARDGEYVIYFAIEPTRKELIFKCISRETALATQFNDTAFDTAVSARNIMNGAVTDEVKEAMKTLCGKIGDRLYIVDEDDVSGGLMTSENITTYISSWIANHNGMVPVVFIDYLQYMPHESKSNMSERAAVDHDLAVLKRYQKKRGLAMFLISSIGRAGYNSSVSMDAAKESGNIEYSADLMWGIQLDMMSSEAYMTAKAEEKRAMEADAKKEIPRKMKLISLKSRNGNAEFECNFSYFPMFDLFIPDTEFCPVFEKEYIPFDDDGGFMQTTMDLF